MQSASGQVLHQNPVFDDYFADPFAWEHEGIYYAIGTGESEAEGRTTGRIFPLLKSRNFVHWEPCERAMERPSASLGDNFWAPEVAYHDGQFYLYYSVGFGDKKHQLRVAISASPEGPYKDCGLTLVDPTECSFAIDAHPFRASDGRWYLFYAKDFLECAPGERPGTALVVAEMESMTRLKGAHQTVLRARSEWQRFEANRLMYGAHWDWHTLEGPTVLERSGKFYCLFSGGRWENETYGVDYGVSDGVLGPYSDAGNEEGPRVLRSVPPDVIGPGHISVVQGPDGEDYIVYHAWDREMRARRLFMDRLEWTPDGPRCLGPSLNGRVLTRGVLYPKPSRDVAKAFGDE